MDEFWPDESNQLLREQYENGENYCIRNNGTSDICYIFCSSNGIYYPSTKAEFVKTIIEEDRYEWKGVSNSEEILASAGKIIFVRDIYKQYYVRGINSSVNSIEKLCVLLNILGGGMRYVVCGTSSGGYLATILGVYLRAECVFNFGGQWSLYKELQSAKEDNKLESSYHFLYKYRNDDLYNQFYDITKLLVNNTVPIMYFYSALNEGDQSQVQVLKNSEASNVYCFAMKSPAHGYTLLNGCHRKVLTCSVQKLLLINNKYKNKMISMRKMAFHFLNTSEAIKVCMKDIVDHHKSLQLVISIFRRRL